MKAQRTAIEIPACAGKTVVIINKGTLIKEKILKL